MLIGSMTMTMLNGTSSRSATFSICATKASHSTSNSMYCCRHDFIRFTQYCSHGFSVWPMQAPHVVIFVNWAVHSLSGRRFVIAFATSAAEESASLKTRVAMKDRFTWPESLSGTSPNGFNSFMYLLTQSRYLWVRREWGGMKEWEFRKTRINIFIWGNFLMRYNKSLFTQHPRVVAVSANLSTLGESC